MIIGISGPLGSGKDTLAEMLVEISKNTPIIGDFVQKRFADKLKLITSIMASVPLEDCYTQEGKNKMVPIFGLTIGELQQKIGTEAMRDGLDVDAWVKSLFSGYNEETDNWIVSDVRFPNEADYVKSRGGILIRIEGDPMKVRANSKRDLNHPSETALNEYREFDYVIINDGPLDALTNFAMSVIADLDLKNNQNAN